MKEKEGEEGVDGVTFVSLHIAGRVQLHAAHEVLPQVQLLGSELQLSLQQIIPVMKSSAIRDNSMRGIWGMKNVQ